MPDNEVGLQSDDEYERLATRDLRDLLGVTIEAENINQPRNANYGRPQPGNRPWIQLPGSTRVLKLARSQPLDPEEVALLRAYVDAIHAFADVPAGFASTASETVLMKAIAVRCAGEQFAALDRVLEVAVRSTSRTYEGSRIATNFCVDLSLDGTNGRTVDELDTAPWASVLGSGTETALQVTNTGHVSSVLVVPRPAEEELDGVLAPYALGGLALWTLDGGAGDRTAVSVNRSGEVFVFHGGRIAFARRDGRWRGYPVDMVLKAGWFSDRRKIVPDVKHGLLATLIDASAGHHGACLGVVPNKGLEAFQAAQLVRDEDIWKAGNERYEMLGGQANFTQMSRRQRLELLSMDGATIVSHNGEILAAGAILQVPAGSDGGGRLAAAKAIAKVGTGLKVSQDGPITAWVSENEEPALKFSLG